ncbi:hypothetical protein B0H14DRAFT_2587233 [Mycena olivaceomarginata]|nr:hypothetical protein B0H14DRAFT_2587233 [Mycena olivaceomarginata]
MPLQVHITAEQPRFADDAELRAVNGGHVIVSWLLTTIGFPTLPCINGIILPAGTTAGHFVPFEQCDQDESIEIFLVRVRHPRQVFEQRQGTGELKRKRGCIVCEMVEEGRGAGENHEGCAEIIDEYCLASSIGSLQKLYSVQDQVGDWSTARVARHQLHAANSSPLYRMDHSARQGLNNVAAIGDIMDIRRIGKEFARGELEESPAEQCEELEESPTERCQEGESEEKDHNQGCGYGG